MSNLVTEEDDVEQNPSCKEENKPRTATTMFLYLRELFFLFALVITSYAALFNSLPKIGKPPSPAPFFSRNSVVSDHYRGTVNLAFQKASEVDLTLIMYYAPWDAESQAARPEFEAAALFLHEEAHFTAISCWSPNTECKQHIPRIKHFPVIVAYPQHNKGIQYKGPIDAVHIIHFVKTLMRPIHRITSPLDIVQLISDHDVVVVGSFLFSGNVGGPGYYTFYSAAMKMLEKDPYNDIVFAVTTDHDMAASIEVELVPSIRLYLWNETFEYPSDIEYTDESLVKWIWNKIHQIVLWISPPGVKSRILSPYVTSGPTLVLFTPRNPLQGVNPVYSLLKEISLRYYNCNNSSWVTHLSKYIEMKNQGLRSSKLRLEQKCSKMRRLERERYKMAVLSPSVVVPQILLNTSECDKKEIDPDVCDASDSRYLGPQLEVCVKRLKMENIPINNSRRSFSFETSMLNNEGDERSPEHLIKLWDDEKCKTIETGNRYYSQAYPKFNKDLPSPDVDGLACINNRTLSIIAMDSLMYYQFAEGLGINILHLKDKTAVAIIDKREESQFILEGDINKYTISSFIVNHTGKSLERSLRSSHDTSMRSLNRFRYPIKEGVDCKHTDTESCVPELNSKNFLDFVMNQTRAVIVFYHTPYCALCRSISHLFLLLARYFRFFSGIQFARIDGDNNDLPWEYTMDLYPTLLFFPTFKKSESRVYSSELPYTIRNMIHFTLANLEPEAKIPAMISLCISFENLQDENEARRCKSKIQKESYENMSKALKDVRITIHRWKNMEPSSRFSSEIRKRRKILIHKLDYFKTVHLLLGSINKLQQNSIVVVDINKLYHKFLLLISGSNYLNQEGLR